MLKIPRLTKSIKTDFRNLTKNSRQPQLVAKVLIHSYAHVQYFASLAQSLSPPPPPMNVVSLIAPSAKDFAITLNGEGGDFFVLHYDLGQYLLFRIGIWRKSLINFTTNCRITRLKKMSLCSDNSLRDK